VEFSNQSLNEICIYLNKKLNQGFLKKINRLTINFLTLKRFNRILIEALII